MHHPLPSFICKSLRGCTSPSLLPCGRRGTACGGGWRTHWLMRLPCMLAPKYALSCQSLASFVLPSCQSATSAGYHPPLPWSPLFQRKRALLRCTTLPISRTRRLSPTAFAIPLFQRKRALLPFLRNKKIPPLCRGGILDIGFSVFTYRYSLL